MKIGQLARATGTSAETIRYYEHIGLMRRPERTESNYRDYAPADADRLAFIRHARGLGFELADIRSLLGLADQPDRDCDEADRIASGHLKAVERKITRLEKLRKELRRMVGQCRGGNASGCCILQVLNDHDMCEVEHT